MKIAVFKYKTSISGWTTKDGRPTGKGECLNTEIIEEEINDFMEDKNVVDIKVTSYTTDRHNNGGADEVWIVYTIMYR